MNKIDEIKNNFIKETYQDTWNVYKKTLERDLVEKWDWIVLTASNKEQAKTYENEINYRLESGVLPKETKYLVIEDPEGKRVGSGGATLNVLRKIKEKAEINNFSNEKILVIHSGGDSKRIPQYSACGKLFSPVQRELPDGRSSTLFDEFIIAFSAIPSRMSPGMIVLSGDVLLVFNPLQIDLHYVETAAISIKAPVETGCNHGVFLTNEQGNVIKFLHKQNVEKLTSIGAVNSLGMVDIDTGAIYFGTKILNKLMDLITTKGNFDNEKIELFISEISRLSFYGDFLYPLAINATLEDYLNEEAEGPINDELLRCRKIIWNKISNMEMKVIKLAPADFIHFGTTHELLDMLTKDLLKYKCLGWNKNVLSNINNKDCIINHSYVNENANIKKNVYIENSIVGENVSIGDNVILSNVTIDNLNIPDNVCINTILMKNQKYVTRIYAINDNPKTEKSENTKFLNTTIEKMMVKYDIADKEIWDTEDKSIWKAKLYQIAENNEESVKSAILLYNIIQCNCDKVVAKEYFKKKRISLCESFNKADMTKIREKNIDIEYSLRSDKFINMIKSKEDYNIAKDVIIKSQNIRKQIENLISNSQKCNSNEKSKIYLAISKIIKEKQIYELSSNYYEELCYNEIKNMISLNEEVIIDKGKIKEKVKIEMPIRVNFGGGWSDTPPYCNENGGNVLNGAFKLNNINPIKVFIKKNYNNKIIFKSVDLKVEKEINNIDEIKDCANNNDPFSLIKASLIVTGIIKKQDKSLKDVIRRMGIGFEITTDVATIPKGSGLGTSSILAGACLKAIYNFLNIKIEDEKLAYKVLEQEQLMGTGGGWQDQIGGLIPGIKFISTEPGNTQIFNIEKIKISDRFLSEINNRFALIYTGQRRLAKNLLRDIMDKYILYDKKTLETIQNIKDMAQKMKETLEKEDLNEFAKLLNEHWELSKALDKGCTNICINQILKSCDDLICGKMICGAGGGGFLQVILREDISKQELEKRINEVFQDSGIKVYNISLM